MTSDIEVVVLDDMRLHLSPHEIARDAEHNSAVFRVTQPASLDSLVCRAEVATAAGTTYRLVTDGEFALTNDIAVAGPGRLQLVYSDGDTVTRKTSVANFQVTSSINAVDPGSPDYPSDGIAQLQTACFARAVGSNDGITFYNISNQPVGAVFYPPAGAGDLTEERANTLYLQLTGDNRMTGSILMLGANRGIVFDALGLGATIYTDSLGFRFRRPIGNSEITIENSDGSGASRSPIVTLQTGDARYLTPAGAETTYLRKAGDQMSGPLISAPGSSSTNPGLGIGDNGTGFYRAGGGLQLAVGGAMMVQWLTSPQSIMFVYPLNMATQGITNLADPVGGQDGANKRYVDNAVAAVPRPNARAYIPTEVALSGTAQLFFDISFPVASNAMRSIMVTVHPSFAGGTAGTFYDLHYSTPLIPGVEEHISVYGTAAAYLRSSARFGATVTPVSNSIRVQLYVRMTGGGPVTLTQVGQRTDLRSYVTIEEMAN